MFFPDNKQKDGGRARRAMGDGRLYETGSLVFFILISVFLVMGILLPNAALSATQHLETKGSSGAYKIGVGDVLDVNVYEVPAASKTVTVRSDGRISLPLVGEIVAAGVTPGDLAKEISKRLVKFIDTPSVTVIINNSAAEVYYVVGQIAKPGQYPLTQPVTVLQAIATAGGFLEWAKKGRIMIVSAPGKPNKISYFNYEDFLGGDATGNVLLKPGDTIVVP